MSAARIAHVREARRQATLARLLGRELAEVWSALLEAEIQEATRVTVRKASGKETALERLRALLDRAGAQVVARAVRLHGGPARYTPRDVARTGEWVTWRQYIETRMRDAASARVARAARTVLEDQGQRGRLAERIRALAGDDVRRGRDALLASRNIIATAEGIGREVAYDEAGIEVIEWLAFRSPIWPRRHDLLNGEMRKRGDMYQMPRSEHVLRWPHDPSGHVSEVINCRCSVAPIVPGSAAYRRWLEQSGQGPGPTGPLAPPPPAAPSAAEIEAEAAALAAEEALRIAALEAQRIAAEEARQEQEQEELAAAVAEAEAEAEEAARLAAEEARREAEEAARRAALEAEALREAEEAALAEAQAAERAALEAEALREAEEAARREAEEAEAEARREAEEAEALREAEDERRAQEYLDRVLGRTPDTRMPLQEVDSMSQSEIADEFDRLARQTPQTWMRITSGDDRPEDNRDVTGVANVLTSYIAGAVRPMLQRHPQVFRAIARRPLQRSEPLWRGMAVTPEVAQRFRAGSTFDIQGASSWSGTRQVSEEFSRGSRDETSVLFRLVRVSRGGDLSQINPGEDEYLLGGRYRVVSVSPRASPRAGMTGAILVDIEEL